MSNEADEIRAAAKQISRDIKRAAKQARRELRRSAKQAAKEGRWQTELEQGLKQSQAVQSELKKVAATMRAELKSAQQQRAQQQRASQQRATRVKVVHEPKGNKSSYAEPSLQVIPLSLAALPPMTTQARQGLGVYALNELAKFERALLGLGINARAEQVSLVWHSDLENGATDGKGRVGLKAQPVADIGGRLFTLQYAQVASDAQETSAVPTARLASEAKAAALAGGEWVAVTPAMWGQVELWQGFRGGVLQRLEDIGSGKKVLALFWVVVLILAFAHKWWMGLLWLFGAGWLLDINTTRPYRAAYFEDVDPPPALREWLWHITGQDNSISESLLPDILHMGAAAKRFQPTSQPQAIPKATPQATDQDMLERLPSDLAAGLRMVRERVADLPEEDIATPRGYHLRQLDNHCEEAAALYLQLPEGSPAKAEAEAEVRAMLEDVLEDLAGAGSRSQQQQEQTLRAIRDLRARSTHSAERDPLKLD